MRNRSYRTLLELGGVLGLVVSVYAALEFFYATLTKVCSFSTVVSCATIANSGKTTILGVPDWAIGVGGFVVILALTVVYERNRSDARLVYLLAGVTSLGVAVSAYLLYVELVEIGAICPVCALAYVCEAVAWVGAFGLARRAYRRAHAPVPAPAPAA